MSGESQGQGEPSSAGAVLREHVEKWAAGIDQRDIEATRPIVAMGEILTERLDSRSAITPWAYAVQTDLLVADCKRGVDGYTGEPMPSTVTRYEPILYGAFVMQATDFARAAFGDEFGDTVAALRQRSQA